MASQCNLVALDVYLLVSDIIVHTKIGCSVQPENQKEKSVARVEVQFLLKMLILWNSVVGKIF